MSRVALMTWFQYYNFGTSLQAFALARVIEGMGHKVSVVNYHTTGKVAVLPCKRPVVSALRELDGKVRRRVFDRRADSPATDRQFASFLNDNLTFTSACETKSDLESLSDEFDCFVCGSDQIWSPAVFDPHYFLDFVDESKLKVAYAPSVGLTEVRDPDLRQRMGELAARIDCLSTRERSGSCIISELSGRDVETVLDPTLLFESEKWNEVAHGARVHVDSAYLLVYMLGHNERHWKRAYEIARRRGLEVRVVPVFRRDLKRKGCITDPVGPREFVRLISGASYVCTDSFHGVAFSILFEKDFCAFERFREDDPINQNSRIHNILEKLGLTDRLVGNGENLGDVISPVLWTTCRSLLGKERTFSLRWLEGALSAKPSFENQKNNVLRRRSLCCGCSACAIICPVGAIDIVLDGEGFWRAKIDESACVSCGKCREVCPFIKRSSSFPLEAGTLFSYKDADSETLLASSSGGAAADIARMSLENRAAVLGCTFDELTREAAHVLVEPEDASGLSALAGSKYMQSRMHPALAVATAYDGPLVVFGTPCQVTAARNLMRQRSDVLYIDLICHGVPSHYLYERYLEWLHRVHGLDPLRTRTEFRYKPLGWRVRYLYSTDGSHIACFHQNEDPYFQLFDSGQCYARCCYECPWRSTSAADIRLGDYWGAKFKKDTTGVSMVLAMTARGMEVVKMLSSSGMLLQQPIDDYLNIQQVKNEPEPVYRSRLLRLLADPRANIETIEKEFAEPEARKRRILERLAPLLSVSKRLLGGGQ